MKRIHATRPNKEVQFRRLIVVTLMVFLFGSSIRIMPRLQVQVY